MHDIGEKSKGKTREGANDPVTEGDMASHRVMYFGLKEAFPSLNIISEEREHKDEKMFIPIINKDKIREEVNIVGGEIHADRLTIWIDPLGPCILPQTVYFLMIFMQMRHKSTLKT